MIRVSFVLMVAAATGLASDRSGFDWDDFDRLAIQERGRIKPVHTFAQESVRFVTGSASFEGARPVETILSWLVEFDEKWQSKKFVYLPYGPLKERLGLLTGENRFAPNEIQTSARFQALLREIQQKQQAREKLSELEAKAVTVQNQLRLLESFVAGSALPVLPNPQGMDLPWFSLDALGELRLPYTGPQKQRTDELVKAIFTALLKNDAAAWNANVPLLSAFMREDLARGHYPVVSDLQREIHFNRLRPFRLAWILYVAAFALLLVAGISKARWANRVGAVAFVGGLIVHSYGFALRSWISGRPPVTNMYESVIWVSWGCAVLSVIIWFYYRNLIIPTAAVFFSIVSLVLADNLPAVLDPGIHPLEPVLRSNFWLTTHVLCITLSYSAFALALCLGNVVLGNFLIRPTRTEWIQTQSLYMYRAMQVGVILVAAGTILGGVWADYSWGRFWGWDPKEVWALIVLLLYVAVLHGRMAGWLRGFGFVAATVFCFLGVLMAWYGVNFVLGVGLHSYGFGAGGLSFILVYVGLQVVFVGAAWLRYEKARKLYSLSTEVFAKRAR